MFTAVTKSSPPAPSSSSTSSITCTMMKMKNIIQNLIFSNICRALSKAKSIFLEILRGNHQLIMYLKNQSHSHQYRKKKYRNKVLFGSFRLHYNWCSSSSHILPMPSPATHHLYKDDEFSSSHIYYDSTWNSVFSTHDHHDQVEDEYNCNMNVNENKGVQDYHGRQQQQGWRLHQDSDAYSELSSYLQWLEEQVDDKSNPNSNKVDGNINEIDMLADMFIKNCHEKFRLEKIESYRRYQEMLARSM